MGYSVNPVASGLKRGQTSSIGLVAIMSYWYSGAVTSGADRVAAENGYDFVVMNAVGGLDRELLIQRARRLGQRVDGALVVDIGEGELLEELIDALAVPVVTIGCRSPSAPAVFVDNVEIGAIAARQLVELDHAFAVVLSPENPSPLAIDNAQIRADGFANAFGEAAEKRIVPIAPTPQRRKVILDAIGHCTAVFCTTDALAIETIAALREAGRPVPDDVSVIGVDDHPLAEAVGLTTVAQEPEAMGEIATAMVIAHAQQRDVDDKGRPIENVQHHAYLVTRHTAGPAPIGFDLATVNG